MNTRQKLKRNISMDAPKDSPIKKPKTRKPLDTRYETPHSSVLSESLVFKLPSSVGPYLSPSKFSPIPKFSSQRNHRRTSSTNLKENASVLHSPFPKGKHPQKLKKYGKAARRANRTRVDVHETSRNPSDSCSSSASSPSSHEEASNSAQKIHNLTISRSRVSQSTSNSPADSPTRTRRPSAPTPPKKTDWKNYVSNHTVSSVDLRAPSVAGHPESHFPESDVFIRPSPNHSQVDFNRPPSQLSMYDYNSSATYDDNMEVDDAPFTTSQDAFFTDVQGTSTPFKNLGSFNAFDRRFGGNVDPAALSRSAFLQSNFDGQDTDTDNDSCRFDSDEDMDHSRPFRALQLASRTRSKSGSGYITPSDDSGDEEICGRRMWVEDSLISPPKTVDWKLCPPPTEDDAYKQITSENAMVTDGEHHKPEHALQDLFDNMILGGLTCSSKWSKLDDIPDHPAGIDTQTAPSDEAQSHTAQLRTRSLDTEHPPHTVTSTNPVPPPARRTRSGTIVPGSSAAPAVESTEQPAVARRTRSGTVVPGNFGILGTASEDGNKPTTLGSSIFGRRTRSGTVVHSTALAPSLPIVEERKSGTSALPSIGRRARSGSIMAPSSIVEGVVSGSTAASIASASSRIRSGGLAALGNALASLPAQATGIIKRPRSGTIGNVPVAVEDLTENLSESTTSTVVEDAGLESEVEDITMSFAAVRNPLTGHHKSAAAPKLSPRHSGDISNEFDPINLLEPMVFASPAPLSRTSSPTHNSNENARSTGLRARAKAAASKAKGFSRNIAGKTGAKGRVLVGPEAGAAAVARARTRAGRNMEDDELINVEDLSDDELLLK
ncbi:hypothetical protein FB446DRAFT_841425 [Lentinula raphanica]|nr:hypothetical protein FB446DRAFT_841425 [Lentinula raphanica]